MSATEYAIGRHCGVTFAGLKIASLVSLRKGEEDVIQTLSRRFAGKGFAFILLREDEERLLVYICHRARLTKYLFSPDVRAFLARFGYEYGSAEEALEQLKCRMKGEFPHEIGIFLGYPVEDVRGFIANEGRNFKACGAWKVYGDGERAAGLFESYRRCTEYFCAMIERGARIVQLTELCGGPA